MSKIVGTILTSSVVAVICTGLFSLINNHINGIKKYAVEEKREWRKEIKNIGEELTATNNMYETRKILNKLKVRINPYGRGKKEDYLHDSHIWEIIKEIEDKPYENQAENKEKLLIYLSLLLQYDYQKNEKIVEGRHRIFTIMFLVLFTFGSLFVIYIHFFKQGREYNENFMLAWTILIVFPICAGWIPQLFKDISNKIREKKGISKFFWGAGVSVLTILFIATVISMIYSVFSYYSITLESPKSNEEFLTKSIALFIMGGLFSMIIYENQDDIGRKYEDEVKQVYNERK